MTQQLQIATQNLETSYFYKLNLGLEHGVELLFIIFHNKYNDPSYNGAPEDEYQLYQLMMLFKSLKPKALQRYQWELLCPPNSQTSNSKEWDVTLLSSLIKSWPRNIPQLQSFLQVPQQVLDIADEIRMTRNAVKHKRLCDLQDQTLFDPLWNQLRSILVRGNYENLTQFDAIESGSLNKIIPFLEDAQKSLEKQFQFLQKEMDAAKNQTRKEGQYCEEHMDDIKIQIHNLSTALEQPCKEFTAKHNELKSKFLHLGGRLNQLSNRVIQLEEDVGNLKEEQEKERKRADKIEERQNKDRERSQKLEENISDIKERQRKVERNFEQRAADEDLLNGIILDEVWNILRQKIPTEELERFVKEPIKIINEPVKMGILDKITSFFPRRKRVSKIRYDYSRKETLCWDEVKKELLKLQRKGVVDFIISTTNVTQDFHDFVENFKQDIQRQLKIASVNPLQDKTGKNRFNKKKLEEAFVDLAIIKDEDVAEKDQRSDREYYFDLLERKKGFVSFKQIESMEDQFISIKGVAGIGKTTLVNKLITEWCGGRLFNNESREAMVHFLLHIECRRLNMLNVDPNDRVADLFQRLFPDLPDLKMLHNVGLNVLIIIDGVDELRGIESIENSHNRSPLINFIYDILDPNFLKKFQRIIVGRPHVIKLLNSFRLNHFHSLSTEMEILGLSENNVTNFVKRQIENATEADDILQKLQSSDVTKTLCTIPLYLQVLISIFKDNPFTRIPETATELLLYNALLFLRNEHQKQTGVRLSLGRFLKNDKEEITQYITEISKFAYDTLVKNEIIFETDETDVLNKLAKLGILLSHENESGIITYQFLHLTFQELFASFHILFEKNTIDLDDPVLRETLVLAAGIQGISCGNYGDTKDYVLFSFLQEMKENFYQNIVEDVKDRLLSSSEDCLHGDELIIDVVFENQTPPEFFSGIETSVLRLNEIVWLNEMARGKAYTLVNLLVPTGFLFDDTTIIIPADLKYFDKISLFEFISRVNDLTLRFEKFGESSDVNEEVFTVADNDNDDYHKLEFSFSQLANSGESNCQLESLFVHCQRGLFLYAPALFQLVVPLFTKLSIFAIHNFLLSDTFPLYEEPLPYFDFNFDHINMKHLKLKYITLDGCWMTDQYFHRLLDLLVHVENIDVSNNKLTQSSLYCLLDRLTPTSALKVIHASNNLFGDRYYDPTNKFNIKCVKLAPIPLNLRKLSLRQSFLTDEDLLTLLDFLVHVEYIDLSKNELTQLALYRLFQYLTPKSSLRIIKFEYNKFVDKHFDEIDHLKVDYTVTIDELHIRNWENLHELHTPAYLQILPIAVRIAKEITIVDTEEMETVLQNTIQKLIEKNLPWKLIHYYQ